METDYVHGYSPRESQRLVDQATTLTELLHSDTRYPAGCHVLEAGCGVGAQTVTLARNSPLACFMAIDTSAESLAAARQRVTAEGLTNVSFEMANIFQLPFAPESFDHVFVCFVLEHLSHPLEALRCLRHVLKPSGTLTVIEGDHGSAYFHPDNAAARKAIDCLIQLQAQAGGNSLIGRQLYPLFRQACYSQVRVSPRMVYADANRPELVEGFTKKTFAAMVEGVREQALAAGLISPAEWDQGIKGLHRAAEPAGTFCYTFFKAIGSRVE